MTLLAQGCEAVKSRESIPRTQGADQAVAEYVTNACICRTALLLYFLCFRDFGGAALEW